MKSLPFKNLKINFILLFVVLVVLGCSAVAFAAHTPTVELSANRESIMDFDVFTDVLKLFKTTLAGKNSVMVGHAKNLFSILVKIDFAIAALLMFIRFEEFNSLFSMLIVKICKYGFWYWFITNWIDGERFANLIEESFSKLGSQAGAGANGILLGAKVMEDPSFFISYGMKSAVAFFSYIMSFSSAWSLSELLMTIVYFLVGAIGGIGIVTAFCLVSFNCFVTMAEFYLVVILGLVMAPFSVWDKTEQFGQANLRYAINVGVKIMFMVAIIGIMFNSFAGSSTEVGAKWDSLLNISGRPGIAQCILVICLPWLFAYLGCEVPALAGAIISGSPALTAHNFMAHMAGAAAVVGAAGAAAAGVGGYAAQVAGGAIDGARNGQHNGGALGGIAGAVTGATKAALNPMVSRAAGAVERGAAANNAGWGSFDDGRGGGNEWAVRNPGAGGSPWRAGAENAPPLTAAAIGQEVARAMDGRFGPPGGT